MGLLSIPEPHAEEIEDDKKKTDAFNGLFSDIEAPIIEELEEEEDIIFTVFLWPEHETIFQVYKIAYNFLNSSFNLPEHIVIELLKEKNLPFSKSLTQLAYIHSGFLSTINFKVHSNG